MKEVWETIYGYEDYQVSNLGRVKSLKFNQERIIKTTKNNWGYWVVNLSKGGITKVHKVHKLVAIAFLNHTPCGHNIVVDHIDNEKSNNRASNLQLISNRENTSKDRSGGSSKHVGVYWNKGSKKWMASIYVNGSDKYLGCFEKEEDASKAYQDALSKTA